MDDYIELAHAASKLRGGYGLTQKDLKKAQESIKKRLAVERVKNKNK